MHHLDLSQSTRVTDRQTDRQTDRITTPKTAFAYARAVTIRLAKPWIPVYVHPVCIIVLFVYLTNKFFFFFFSTILSRGQYPAGGKAGKCGAIETVRREKGDCSPISLSTCNVAEPFVIKIVIWGLNIETVSITRNHNCK